MAPVLTADDVSFAPLGLSNMLNTGGTVCDVVQHGRGWRVSMQGVGTLVAYASQRPQSVHVGAVDHVDHVDFDHGTGTLRVAVGPGTDTVDVQF